MERETVQVDKLMDELIESRIDDLLEGEAYYVNHGSALKSAAELKQTDRSRIEGVLAAPKLSQQLQKMTQLLQDVHVDPEHSELWERVKREIREAGAPGQRYLSAVQAERPIFFQEILNISDQSMMALYEFGMALLDKGMADEASAIYIFLSTLAPYVSSFWIAQGICFEKLQRFDEAILALETARFLDPQNPMPAVNLHAIYQQLNETEKAEAELQYLKEIKGAKMD